MWFSQRADQQFDDCVEVGAHYQTRLAGYQVDRSTLDQHLLDNACAAGCELIRPAKVAKFELNGSNGQSVTLSTEAGERTVTCRWLVDASGRAAILSRKLGYFRQNTEHPISAVWARFAGVKDWDSYEWRERFPAYANACRTSRSWATNHLMGDGWWCWVIPLRGGDVSAGLVYDSRIFNLPPGANLAERLHSHIVQHPIGREIFADAKAIDGDVHAFSNLPYSTEQVCGDGWAIVGDAAGFIDPLYSPGLDFCSYTSYTVGDFVARSVAGEDVSQQLQSYAEQYPITYRYWFETLYKDKYHYMGDAELMSAALLLDVGSYFVGLVIPVYRDPEREFFTLPFGGFVGRLFGDVMSFYNRRLVVLAQRRKQAGYFGSRNAGWREMYDGFVPDIRVRKLIQKGLFRWWKAELTNLRLMFATRQKPVASQPAAAATRASACEV